MYSHFRHSSTPGLDKLWIISPVSNPQRYRSRYRLFEDYQARLIQRGVNLMTVELALGDRPFEMQRFSREHHHAVRAWDEIWHKEALINLAISRLPSDWEYVAWIDGDVEFVRPDWPEEICHQLQHYQVIQCFENAIDLGPTGEAMTTFTGFVASWQKGRHRPKPEAKYGPWHPGFAWAARREAIDHLGGLFDTAALGAGDHHMAWALLGEAVAQTPKGISPGYKRALERWEERAVKHIRRDIGFMPGTITHNWHGKKRDRRYGERWKILLEHGYDPELDLKRDWQGLYCFTDAGERMRNDFRGYFRARNEDSVDL